MKKRFFQAAFALIALALLFIDIGTREIPTTDTSQNYKGEVLSVSTGDATEEFAPDDYIQTLEVEILDGPRAGERTSINNNVSAYANGKEYVVGDNIVLIEYESFLGENQLFIMDYVRTPVIYALFALFIGLVLLINKKKGAYAILSMAFSFLVILKLTLPLLLKGFDPVTTVLASAILILPAIFYLSHGWHRKTHIAITSTLITLVITGLLATIFTDLAQLSGLGTEEAGFLKLDTGEAFNFRGLLLAGIIISVLGILDDVTITQTSVVQELKAAQKKISKKELFKRSMTVGRDHIASVINTLILVYAGASLPLLILFIDSSQTLDQTINFEFMSEEIVRTLVGSIGLILAVPITSYIASTHYHKLKHVSEDSHGHH